MTIEEKAEKIAVNWTRSTGPCKHLLSDILALVGDVRKEQDRDTRHACAEAVMALPEKYTIDGDDGYVDVNQAHSTIMNCRGGVE